MAIAIAATEKTSTTAATPAVISDTTLDDDAEITIDIDAVGSTIAGAGLKVYLIGTKTRQRGFLLNPARFAGGGGGGPTDPDFANVSLLCHFDGADTSTTITDNSPSPKTLTAYGNAQIDTAQSKFGGASLLLDGTGDYVSTPADTVFNFGSGEFTVEAWVRFASLTGDQTITGQCGASGLNTTVSFVVQKTAANVITAFGCQGAVGVGGVDGTTTVTTGVWYHVAYVREANTF
eukprot:gene26842-48282_t